MVKGKKLPASPRATIDDAVDAERALLRDGDALTVVDLTSTATVARREIAGLVWARVCGSMLEIKTRDEWLLGRADLSGELRPWPVPRYSPSARIGDLALFTVLEADERVRVLVHLATGEEIARVRNEVTWHDADPESGLFFGSSKNDIVAARATDASVAWTTRAFKGRVADPWVRVARGRVVAGATQRGAEVRVHLDPWTGAALPAREEPDFEDELVAESVRVEEGQAVVERRGHVARVALPGLGSWKRVGPYLAGILRSASSTELVIVPLPEDGDHALELEPVGEAPPEVGPYAVVTMVGKSIPFVIADHPTYGRVNLPRSDALVEKGDKLVLEGVVVKPGGVVDVARWRVAGAAPPRETTRVEFGKSRG